MSNLSSCESSCDGPSCDADGCPSDCGRSTAVDQILSPPFDHKLPPQSPLASLFEVGNPSCSGRETNNPKDRMESAGDCFAQKRVVVSRMEVPAAVARSVPGLLRIASCQLSDALRPSLGPTSSSRKHSSLH
ncbi:hypothetical protein WJX82_005881 [Trebouxia sp. C0006]